MFALYGWNKKKFLGYATNRCNFLLSVLAKKKHHNNFSTNFSIQRLEQRPHKTELTFDGGLWMFCLVFV